MFTSHVLSSLHCAVSSPLLVHEQPTEYNTCNVKSWGGRTFDVSQVENKSSHEFMENGVSKLSEAPTGDFPFL